MELSNNLNLHNIFFNHNRLAFNFSRFLDKCRLMEIMFKEVEQLTVSSSLEQSERLNGFGRTHYPADDTTFR
jgi:hypothetical protein